MLRTIIAVPVLIVVVLFALSNKAPTEFRLWPTDYSVVLPLSLAVLGAMAVAFIIGAAVLWLSVLAARHRARRAERQVQVLEAQVAELKARLTPTPGSSLVPASTYATATYDRAA
jgi:putative membrane protein